jgi:hypothetical protein
MPNEQVECDKENFVSDAVMIAAQFDNLARKLIEGGANPYIVGVGMAAQSVAIFSELGGPELAEKAFTMVAKINAKAAQQHVAKGRH